MKLKTDFITQIVDDTQFIVPIGNNAFSGIVRSNKTGAFIVDCLKEETSKEEIIEKMLAKYDADRSIIERDVQTVIDKLTSIGALENL